MKKSSLIDNRRLGVISSEIALKCVCIEASEMRLPVYPHRHLNAYMDVQKMFAYWV